MFTELLELLDLNYKRRVVKLTGIVLAIVLVLFTFAVAVAGWGTPFHGAVLWIGATLLLFVALAVWALLGPWGDALMVTALLGSSNADAKLAARFGKMLRAVALGIAAYVIAATLFFYFFAGHSTLGLLLILSAAGAAACKTLGLKPLAKWFGRAGTVAAFALISVFIYDAVRISATPFAGNGWVKYGKERFARSIARSTRSYWEVRAPVAPLEYKQGLSVSGKPDTLCGISCNKQLAVGTQVLQARDADVPKVLKRVPDGAGMVEESGTEYVPVYLRYSETYPELGFNQKRLFLVPRGALAEKANLDFAKPLAIVPVAAQIPVLPAPAQAPPAKPEAGPEETTGADEEETAENAAPKSARTEIPSARRATYVNQDWDEAVPQFNLIRDAVPYCVKISNLNPDDSLRVEIRGSTSDSNDPYNGAVMLVRPRLIAKNTAANPYPAPGEYVGAVLFYRTAAAGEQPYQSLRAITGTVDVQGGTTCLMLNTGEGSSGSYVVRLLRFPQT